MAPSGAFRIGTGAGFAADRLDPAVDLAKHGKLDVMVLECLGERTVAFAHRDRMANPARGYNAHLDRRMRALLPACREAGTVIVTNMGAANPRAAAERTRHIARELGLKGLKIACIEGDDVTARVPMTQPFMDEQGTLGDIGQPIVGMNAYLGADAILPALQANADVIIGGRLADPSMYLAPLMQRYGWSNSDLPRLGAGTLVGHVLDARIGEVAAGDLHAAFHQVAYQRACPEPRQIGVAPAIALHQRRQIHRWIGETSADDHFCAMVERGQDGFGAEIGIHADDRLPNFAKRARLVHEGLRHRHARDHVVAFDAGDL